MKKFFLLLMLPILLGISPTNAQGNRLSGALTIGAAASDDYSTLTEAVNDLINNGVSEGGVTFLVAPGNYPERITLSTFEGASETAQVVFRANGGTVTINGTGTSGTTDAMVILNGVSWVTFDGINILDGGTSASNQVEMGYVITGTATQGSKYNTIKNASIMMGGGENPELRNTRGVAFISNASEASGTNSFNTIHNLTIDKVGWGIRVTGKTTTMGNIQFVDEGNVISGCTLGSTVRIGHNSNASSIGIYLQAQEKVRVFDNVIDNVFGSPEVTPALPVSSSGISVDASAGEIFNNRINYVRFQGSGASSAYGIRITVLAGDTMKVYNNFISNIQKSNEYTPPTYDNSMYVVGIWSFAGIGGAGNLNLYHNTIFLNHEEECDFPSAAVYTSASSAGIPPVEMFNNILINNLISSQNFESNYGNTSYAFVEGNPELGTHQSNNNLFYVSDPNGVLIQKGRRLGSEVTNYLTLPEWSIATGHDNNSVSKMVNFVEPGTGNLHLAGASVSDPQLAANLIEGIDFDIDYDERSETPGMGADEYDPSEAVVNLQGTVSDLETEAPLQGVLITIGDFQVQTAPNGGYSLSILPGEYTLFAEKEEYISFSMEISIPEMDTVIDFQMAPIPIPMTILSGVIEGSDNTGTGIENAQIRFIGQEEYPLVFTDTEGSFTIEIPANIDYTYRVVAYGYEPLTGSITPDEGYHDMGVIVLTEFPFAPIEVTASIHEGVSEIQWEAPIPGLFTGFRYDSGIAEGQLGFQNGTENSVMGAVHRRNSVIDEISWYLTGEGGPHSLVNLFVFGLDEEGMPDRNNMLYVATNINNKDNEWNTHYLSESLSVPNGFMVGVSASGFLAIAHDEGTDPWAFQENTQFATTNFLTNDFISLEQVDFEVNLLIRAAGIDFGPAGYEKPKSFSPAMPITRPLALSLSKPVKTRHISDNFPRALLDYTVYRLKTQDEDNQEEWELLVEKITATNYSDIYWNELDEGEYLYAVIARYTGEVLSDAAFSNALIAENEGDPIMVTINVLDENQAPIANAAVTLQNGETYTANTGEQGSVEFTDVISGTYQLLVTASGYEDELLENMTITESLTLDVELTLASSSMNDESAGSIRIYPNPVKEYFMVNAESLIEVIEVHDIFGRLIYRANPAQADFEVNTANWRPGQYFVKLYSIENSLHIEKILKN
jgi:hypothetical protein